MKRIKGRAQKILNKLSKSIPTPPLTNNGNLDVEAYNCLPEVKSAIERLKACGYISSKLLIADGFIPAGLVLRF